MPASAYSSASDAVIALMPPLAAEYGMRWMPRVAAEETLTMTPSPRSTIDGSAARQRVQRGHQRPVDLRPDLGVGELGERLEVDRAADIVDQHVDAAERRKRLSYN